MKKHSKYSRKGMELPLNTLVILAIVIIVLLAVAALFMGVWGPTGGGVSLTSAKTNYCAKLLNTGTCGSYDPASIKITDFDADRDGKVDEGTDVILAGDPGDTDNLLTLCLNWYGCDKTTRGAPATLEEAKTCCRKNVCGCPQV